METGAEAEPRSTPLSALSVYVPTPPVVPEAIAMINTSATTPALVTVRTFPKLRRPEVTEVTTRVSFAVAVEFAVVMYPVNTAEEQI
jgi:hypothetical protein